MTTTLLNIHHGLMAASAVVQAINWVVGHLVLLWLAWQMLFRSGLEWRWFRLPQLFNLPIAGVEVSLRFIPGIAEFGSFPLFPRRVPYEWTVRWLWFQFRWQWIT